MDKRLMLISDRLKEVNKEVEELEWNCDTLELGPDKLQALYLEREHLQYLLQKGDSYVPLF
jgi:IS30 family transposase